MSAGHTSAARQEGVELSVPRDALGFACRECPSCHRTFKTRHDVRDQWVAASMIGKNVPHANLEDVHDSQALPRRCPYCGATAAHDAWLTEAQRQYLEAAIQSLRAEIRHAQLVHGLGTLRDNPRRTFVPMPAPGELPVPPREGEDLRLLRLSCCGEETMVAGTWTQPIYCPVCGQRARLVTAERRHGADLHI